MTLLRWVAAAALLLGPLTASAEVHEYTLKNGLKLLVKEDHRAPVVVSQVWYRVGSSYEHDGITGISHVLEHMMFQGTGKHPSGEFSRIIAANGGDENAFTSRDYTAYYQLLEKSRLPIAFSLEADRMRGLVVDPKEFDRERRVVMEERRMRTEDKPRSLTYERFVAGAWLNNPYRIPPIGWQDDLEQLTVDDLRAWYRRWYAPDNATVVVVGDVEPGAVRALAEKYFGPLPAERIAPPKRRDEPASLGSKRITVRAPGKLPYLLMGYRVPTLGTAAEAWEPYALEMLSGILDGGDSARLARRLVRGQQVAASAGAGYTLHARLDDLFILDGLPARGRDIDEVEAALREEVRRIKEEPIDPRELARVKAQVVTGEVYERDSVQYQATQLGKLESLGLGWRAGEEYVERIRAVTPEQVREVARKYLTDDRLTVAVLLPESGE
ncbi:M16 family metallopeptidase [Endothiovibrio diazotrophicus]